VLDNSSSIVDGPWRVVVPGTHIHVPLHEEIDKFYLGFAWRDPAYTGNAMVDIIMEEDAKIFHAINMATKEVFTWEKIRDWVVV